MVEKQHPNSRPNSLIQAQTTLNELRSEYRRGEIEIRRNGMLWQDELIEEGSRWEIKKVEEYDPEKLEMEGRILPLPPPLLGVKYVYWNFAPRAIPIGKDPLRWLNLSAEDWKIIGNQIVSKGQGGHGSDDEYDDEDDPRRNIPQFPDQPDFGPRDLWDKAKCWLVRKLSQEHPELEDKQILMIVIDNVQRNGWPWLAELYICYNPGEVSRRLEDGMPKTPSCFTIRDHFVAQWMASGCTLQQSRMAFNRKVIIHGWDNFSGRYRDETDESEFTSVVVRDYAERTGYGTSKVTAEQFETTLQQRWGTIRMVYERNRIQKEWRNYQQNITARQRKEAEERGEEFEIDIEDDQGVTAQIRAWVRELLEQENEISESEEVQEDSAEMQKETEAETGQSEEEEIGNQTNEEPETDSPEGEEESGMNCEEEEDQELRENEEEEEVDQKKERNRNLKRL
jgi:hypothetical protein